MGKSKHDKEVSRRRKLHEANVAKENQRILQARRNIYPRIIFREELGRSDFVQAIRSIVERLRFESFPEPVRKFLKCGHRDGFEMVLAAPAFVGELSADVQSRMANLQCFLGCWIIDQLTEDQKDKLLPFNDVQVRYVGYDIELVFMALRMASENGQHFYYSPLKPKLEIDGAKKIVAFEDHVIKRIAERRMIDWRNYMGLGDAFAFLGNCVYFEETRSRPLGKVIDFTQDAFTQLAFTCFDTCGLAAFHPQILNSANEYYFNVLGSSAFEPSNASKPWYYRVGYCSAEINGEFVVGTTFLPPGFSKTPEFGLLKNSRIDHMRKEEMERLATTERVSHFDHAYFELLKWFHDHGIPQVVSIEQDVFQSPDGRNKAKQNTLENSQYSISKRIASKPLI